MPPFCVLAIVNQHSQHIYSFCSDKPRVLRRPRSVTTLNTTTQQALFTQVYQYDLDGPSPHGLPPGGGEPIIHPTTHIPLNIILTTPAPSQLVFSAIVAGITGYYLHHSGQSAWDLGRFIYTEVVAGLSILLSLLWLFPFSGSFIHWPTDLVLSAAWFAAFGLLVDQFHGTCGNTFDWSNLHFRGTNCGTWKSDEAFAFLSAICWLVSALLGARWVRKHTDRQAAAQNSARTRWYRRSRV